jgi:hypothetical protein
MRGKAGAIRSAAVATKSGCSDNGELEKAAGCPSNIVLIYDETFLECWRSDTRARIVEVAHYTVLHSFQSAQLSGAGQMPNDAKLGLVVGLGVVIVTSVVFYRKDSAVAPPLSRELKSAAVSSATPLAVDSSTNPAHETEVKPTARTNDAREALPD